MIDDTYLVLTPFGVVTANFGDGQGVSLQGSADAVALVEHTIARSCNAMGMSLSVGQVEPADFVHFCQPAGSGITIIEPADALTEPQQDEDEPVINLLDSVSDDLRSAIASASGSRAKLAAARALQASRNQPDSSADLPPGWGELKPGGMATNNDALVGGIIDKNRQDQKWFLIFNRDDLHDSNGYDSRAEAFAAFARQLAENPVPAQPDPQPREEGPIEVEGLRALLRTSPGGVTKLMGAAHFTYEDRGEDVLFNDRQAVEKAIGAQLVEVRYPGYEAETALAVPAEAVSAAEALLARLEQADPYTQDTKWLQAIVDGQFDLQDATIPDRLEALFQAHEGDADMQDLLVRAANAYSNAAVAAAQGALKS